MLKLYNTLSRKKEPFKPISPGKVGIYSCGPTVYWYQHIGNLRTYIFSDILKRTLQYNGLKVKHVMNVTDVGHLTSDRDEGEDKIELSAKKERKTAKEIANYYLKIFKQDLKKLNIIEPDIWPKATHHIKEQIDLIKKLEKKGFTYKTSDGIYFNSKKFKKYGELARLNVKKLQAGKRIEKGAKKHKTDFALWKFSQEKEKRQQEWSSPWGIGFPGWHIECSAMSMKYLGNHFDTENRKFSGSEIAKKHQTIFDIHTGGEDHIPVHHTNEIAQSEAATGRKFVNYWLHSAFLQFKGQKVAKSTGGLYTISELEKQGYNPLDFRYLCLLTHYRKPLNFTLENLDAAKNALERMKRKVSELRKEVHKGIDETKTYEKQFEEAINDDLNMPKAMQVSWNMIDDFDFSPKLKLKLLEKFDKVLGLNIKNMKETKITIPKEIRDLINEREKLRKAKMWKEADIFRQRIREKGYIVEDKSEGPSVRKI